ncbi:MAG: hypothetical protein KDK45_18115, partial [Leptospiraceae bacterium]|nr:hypothetical protein [Leptospiraceae bacterium]
MIKYIYICLIILSFFVDSLFSEPLSPEKGQTHIRPETAAFYGLVPGLGQIINGEYFSAATQVLTFSSAAYLSSYYVRHRDYIHINERKIDFDPFYTYLSNEISARNMYNKDVPAPGIWETEYERRLRFLKEKKMAEQNPLLEYGPYTRINQVSLYAQMAEQTMLHTLFYSVYSAYRDTGVMGEERSK